MAGVLRCSTTTLRRMRRRFLKDGVYKPPGCRQLLYDRDIVVHLVRSHREGN